MSDVVISVQNVSKKFSRRLRHVMMYGAADIARNMVGVGSRSEILRDGEFWAVDDVSFELKRGETLGIIGSNGSGKSTMLKMLNGIYMPDKGRIEIKGRVGALIEVGAGFHPMLTGRENVYINGAILGMSKAKIDRKFNDIVEFADIGDFIDSPVKHYSSGMFVRLGFAVAVHSEPDILLVDEVLAVGDVGFQAKCLERIQRLLDEDCTVVFVSHNASIIARMCEKAIWLEKSTVVESGHAPEVVANYTAGSLGERVDFDKSGVILPGKPDLPMCLRAISITDSKDAPQDELDLSAPFRVKLRYDVNQPVKNAHVICFFYTADGINILGTSDADSNPDLYGEREKGSYEAEFEIPAYLLNTGKYYITVSLGLPFALSFDRHEMIIGFTVTDPAVGNNWLKSRHPGILNLRFPWKYNRKVASQSIESSTSDG